MSIRTSVVTGMAAAVLLVGTTVGQASTWYVSTSGTDTNNGSQAQPWRSVTNALAWASTNDTILMAGGVYGYASTISFASNDVSLTLQGGYDPADWSWSLASQSTVIRNTNGYTVLAFPVALVTNTLRYLTLSGATATTGARSGISVSSICGLVVEGCSITGNVYGISASIPGQLSLRNTVIAHNSSYGIYSYYPEGGTLQLLNCTIADNGSDGFYCHANPTSSTNLAPVVTNTLFTGNGRYGITVDGVKNCGVAAYCLFYGNSGGAWSGLLPDGGHNKLGPDPRYVNPAGGNYQLQANSPAAAAGTDLSAAGVTNDIVNAARPGANGWDMGACQGSGAGAPALVAAGYVSKLGSDDTGNGSSTNPWASVAYGAASVVPSGTLYVAGGIYAGNVSLGVGTRTIRGGYNPLNWSWTPASQRTTIFGNGYAPVALLVANSTNTLRYVTLCNGTNGNNMAGLFVNAACGFLGDGCTITGNSYGVAASVPAQLEFRNTLIARNSSQGIYARYPGGGSCRLLNCTIADNGANGYYCHVSNDSSNLTPVVTNSLFTGNNGNGIVIDGTHGTGSVDYACFYGNTSGAFSTRTPTLGTHITTNEDPQYVNAGNGDYRIMSNSPAFNTGTNLLAAGVAMDIVGVSRPQSGLFDRGAYELPVETAGTTILVR